MNETEISYVAINLIYFIVILMMLLVTNAYGTKLRKEMYELKEKYFTLLSQKKSSEVRLGQISENLAPFLKDFKYNPKKAHFLGNPIDYIIFEDNKIVFLEVKSGESKLSRSQKDIKQLILDGKVEFDQMRIN